MNYYNEIKNIIEERETNKRVREIQDNREDLLSRWNIGKLLVDAQGGKERAKYGSSLIKEWGLKFERLYGKSYSYPELRKFRQFYNRFENCVTLSRISWNHIVAVLPIKNINERNYYINQVIISNLSVRELRKIIKDKTFERLSYVDKNNVSLIENDDYELTIEDMIKEPILIKVDSNVDSMNEKILHKYIIDMLEERFLELGTGFALIGHEYKIIINNRTYKIDLLFFNTKLQSYIIVELKVREIHKEDISQLQFYVNYFDKNIKENFYNNKTIGVLIVKKNNKLIVEYTTNKDLFVTTYKLIEKNGDEKYELLQ